MHVILSLYSFRYLCDDARLLSYTTVLIFIFFFCPGLVTTDSTKVYKGIGLSMIDIQDRDVRFRSASASFWICRIARLRERILFPKRQKINGIGTKHNSMRLRSVPAQ